MKVREQEDPMWKELQDCLANTFANGRLHIQYYAEAFRYVGLYCESLPHSYGCTECRDTDEVGIGVYKKGMRDFLGQYLQSLLKESGVLTGSDLLEFYTRRWRMYMRSVRITCKKFRHFDRLWIKEQDAQDPCEAKGVYELALHSWKDIILNTMSQRVMIAMLDLIHKHRTGDIHDAELIRGVILSYTELGKYDQTSGRRCLDVYEDHFEVAFLESSEKYYVRESCTFLEEHSDREYPRKVESLLKAEEKLLALHQHELTQKRLVAVCNTQLIGKHLQTLYSAFQKALESDESEDVSLTYTLVTMVEDVAQLALIFKEHIISKGEEAIAKCANKAINDSKLYVQTLLEVHQKYDTLTSTCFHEDRLFITAVNQACQKFMNINAVTKGTNCGSKSAELLARYCDMVLRKSSDRPDEMKDNINKVVTVFKYLTEQEIFQEFYLKLQARRLVQLMPTGVEGETSIVLELRKVCAPECTSKLQQMIHEFNAGRTLQQQFHESLKNSLYPETTEFEAAVFSGYLWPFKQFCDFTLPAELDRSCQSFARFYTDLNEHRILRWHFHMCSGQVVTNCFKKRYTIQASVYQVAVLLLYNSAVKYTYEELLQATALPDAILGPAVQRLLTSKLLIRNDCSAVNEVLQSTTVLRLAFGYTSKKQSINVNLPLKAEVDAQKTQRQNL